MTIQEKSPTIDNYKACGRIIIKYVKISLCLFVLRAFIVTLLLLLLLLLLLHQSPCFIFVIFSIWQSESIECEGSISCIAISILSPVFRWSLQRTDTASCWCSGAYINEQRQQKQQQQHQQRQYRQQKRNIKPFGWLHFRSISQINFRRNNVNIGGCCVFQMQQIVFI